MSETTTAARKKYIIFTRAYNFKRKLNEENLLRCLRVEDIIFYYYYTALYCSGRICKQTKNDEVRQKTQIICVAKCDS